MCRHGRQGRRSAWRRHPGHGPHLELLEGHVGLVGLDLVGGQREAEPEDFDSLSSSGRERVRQQIVRLNTKNGQILAQEDDGENKSWGSVALGERDVVMWGSRLWGLHLCMCIVVYSKFQHTCRNSSRVGITRRGCGAGSGSRSGNVAAGIVAEARAEVGAVGASVSGSVMLVSCDVLVTVELSNSSLVSGDIDLRAVVGCHAEGGSWS